MYTYIWDGHHGQFLFLFSIQYLGDLPDFELLPGEDFCFRCCGGERHPDPSWNQCECAVGLKSLRMLVYCCCLSCRWEHLPYMWYIVRHLLKLFGLLSSANFVRKSRQYHQSTEPVNNYSENVSQFFTVVEINHEKIAHRVWIMIPLEPPSKIINKHISK